MEGKDTDLVIAEAGGTVRKLDRAALQAAAAGAAGAAAATAGLSEKGEKF
jgi:hypothetical protein